MEFHADWQIAASIPMLVHDVDQDGRNDILMAKGTITDSIGGNKWHRLRWQIAIRTSPHRQSLLPTPCSGPCGSRQRWQTRLITGKRYFAHNGGVSWWKRDANHCLLSIPAFGADLEQNRVGRGTRRYRLQIATGDLNGDQAIDIAVAGKSGTYILFNPQLPAKVSR